MTTKPTSIRVPVWLMERAQSYAKHEERSVSYILLRWLQLGAGHDVEMVLAQSIERERSASSDTGTSTKAQINAVVDPSSDGPAARGCKTPEAQSLPWRDRGPDWPPQTDDEAQSIDGVPRIRIGSGLNGGESYDHRQAQSIPPKNSGEVLRKLRETQGKTGDPVIDQAQIIIDAADPATDEGQNALYSQIPAVINRLLELDAQDQPFNPYDCPDCREAMKHAYSDATTPGFFYDRCEKHRRLPVDNPDIRNAVGVVTTEEMTIEEAKRRFPGVEIGAPDAKTDTRREPSPTSTGTREKIAPAQTRTPASRIQSGRKGGSKDRASRSERVHHVARSGSASVKRDPQTAQAKLPAKDLAKKIPGVAVAAEVPPPARDPRKPCPSCGALHGMHQKSCSLRGGK